VLYIGGGQSDGRVVGKTQKRSESHQVHEEEESKDAAAALYTAEFSRSAMLRQRQGNGGGLYK